MSKGDLALVLHAHLPYVRSAKKGSLEEDWFFQALIECYLPLLESLENSANSSEEDPKITIGLSPTLLSLLDDNELKKRFPEWLLLRLNLLNDVPREQRDAAKYLKNNIESHFNKWIEYEGDLIKRFSELEKKNIVDLLTCSATHGYLPLLRENEESVHAQLKTAIREHIRLFAIQPQGIWLPECAYYEGLDKLMNNLGLRYAVLDTHGLLHANPRPRYGIYSPICTNNGVAFFARDSDSTLPVWSAKDGYPGDPNYREFHKDIGWELDRQKLQAIGIRNPRPLGLKLYRVTGRSTPLNKKEIYKPNIALKTIRDHADSYLQGRKNQIEVLAKAMNKRPLLVAPFDAELFGHWWYEGPKFLSELFKQAPRKEINFVRLKDILKTSPTLQLSTPCPSSWGKGGYHEYWMNESNSWIIPQWSKASKIMIELSTKNISNELDIRILNQAAKELLLSQSSDWSFILRAGTTTDLAKSRIETHLNRFWMLINSFNQNKEIDLEDLKRIESEDNLFPLIDFKDWSKDK